MCCLTRNTTSSSPLFLFLWLWLLEGLGEASEGEGEEGSPLPSTTTWPFSDSYMTHTQTRGRRDGCRGTGKGETADGAINRGHGYSYRGLCGVYI